jgi:hypothetical protein
MSAYPGPEPCPAYRRLGVEPEASPSLHCTLSRGPCWSKVVAAVQVHPPSFGTRYGHSTWRSCEARRYTEDSDARASSSFLATQHDGPEYPPAAGRNCQANGILFICDLACRDPQEIRDIRLAFEGTGALQE